MRFHGRCFVCDGCGNPLSDRFYSNNNQFFHEECVSCSICAQNLHGKNFSQLQDGGYICDPCLYNSMRQQGQLAALNGGTSQVPQLQQQGQYNFEPAVEEAWMPQNQQMYQQQAYYQQQQYAQQQQYQPQYQQQQYAQQAFGFPQQQYGHVPQQQQQQYLPQQQFYSQHAGKQGAQGAMGQIGMPGTAANGQPRRK